jgi:hypothetical protein
MDSNAIVQAIRNLSVGELMRILPRETLKAIHDAVDRNGLATSKSLPASVKIPEAVGAPAKRALNGFMAFRSMS